jgi:transcriptional regulator with XRE-family HTH domain
MAKARTQVPTPIGKWIRRHRTERGWSQTQLGGRINAHVTSVSDWERGDNLPSARHLATLAAVFGDRPPAEEEDEEEAADPVASLMDAIRAIVRQEVRV